MRFLTSIFSFVMRHENWCFLIFFVVFVCFIDSNSLWERHFVWENTANIRREINDYTQRYLEDSIKLADLKNDPYRLEQVARERYYMTRPNEDLFIIQEEQDASDPSQERSGREGY